MDKAPSLFSLKELQNHQEIIGVQTEIDGQWVPARPYGLFSLKNRVKLAWGVFTGKYDAVTWPGGQ